MSNYNFRKDYRSDEEFDKYLKLGHDRENFLIKKFEQLIKKEFRNIFVEINNTGYDMSGKMYKNVEVKDTPDFTMIIEEQKYKIGVSASPSDNISTLKEYNFIKRKERNEHMLMGFGCNVDSKNTISVFGEVSKFFELKEQCASYIPNWNRSGKPAYRFYKNQLVDICHKNKNEVLENNELKIYLI